MSAYEWAQDQYDAKHVFVQTARALLERWFQAIESGVASQWQPDPFGQAITAAQANRVVEHLDMDIEKDLSWASQVGYTLGPGFQRLALPQRIALCQQLHRLKVQYGPLPPRVPRMYGYPS